MKIQYVQTYPVITPDTTQGKNGNGTNRNQNGPGELLWLVQKPAGKAQSNRSLEELLKSELQATRVTPKPATSFGEYASGQKPLIDEIEQRAMAHLHEFWA